MIMKRKITWKQLFSSSVIRVMCIVIAVMIPVNVVTILLGKMAVKMCIRDRCHTPAGSAREDRVHAAVFDFPVCTEQPA